MPYQSFLKPLLLGSACASFLSAAAFADNFNIPGGDLVSALDAYTSQTGVALIVSDDAIAGVRTKGVTGALSPNEALSRILSGTGFVMQHRATGAITVIRNNQRSDAQTDGSFQLAQASLPPRATVETVTVTSSKLGGGDVQSIPIAITALSQEQLQAQKIEGGPDLLKSIPNMTFSKNNFSGYNIDIRGIGTKAVSVTTDPAVAVSFNDTTLIRNRFFEQEFFDVSQVEVLRGPQGTLYGRNATAGVVNIISAKPTDEFEAQFKAEAGNYSSKRLSGFVNVPLVGDKLDLRVAGAWTKRNGYDYDETTDDHVNGRDLWSTRTTLGFKPFEKLHGELVWEHFNESDDRSRTGKQLCTTDPGLTSVGGVAVTDPWAQGAELSQGCLPGSLYGANAFGTPNGLAIPFIGTLEAGSSVQTPDGNYNFIIQPGTNPYAGVEQSHDVRTIASQITPVYRARADLVELNFNYDISPELTFTSQTAYDKDKYYASQDYNRFSTVSGIFPDTGDLPEAPNQPTLPGGYFNDPQLGSANSIVGMDISQARSEQFSQEFRVRSSFEGPLNFSAGVDYTKYHTLEDYYVFFNAINILEKTVLFDCYAFFCSPADNNPLGSITGDGHNYFRSQNPYQLESKALFGELYWQVAPEVKLTGGLRYTDDKKRFTPIPSETLLSNPDYLLQKFGVDYTTLPASFQVLYGQPGDGYPALPDINQQWREVTGRFNAQYTPKLDFTDQTMLYASYSRGYKGGGANPPGIGRNAAPEGMTFKPEFINAYEVGTKNSLLDDSLTLNGDVFFYDYKDYQISKIVERSAANENFNARVWGAELEATWEPLPGLRFNFAGGAQDSVLANGSKSIDVMDRTQGNPNWTLVKPSVTFASNCIAPTAIVAKVIQQLGPTDLQDLCPGGGTADYSNFLPGSPMADAIGESYDPLQHPEANYGQGISKDVSGNELPNAPHFTLSVGAQYAIPVTSDWTALVRTDFYWQTNSWARVYNDNPYDVLHGWSNLNLTLDVIKSDGLQLEFYVKNVLNTTAITDAFLNSDDSALTTNVFTTDPRLIGFSITKSF